MDSLEGVTVRNWQTRVLSAMILFLGVSVANASPMALNRLRDSFGRLPDRIKCPESKKGERMIIDLEERSFRKFNNRGTLIRHKEDVEVQTHAAAGDSDQIIIRLLSPRGKMYVRATYDVVTSVVRCQHR